MKEVTRKDGRKIVPVRVLVVGGERGRAREAL